MYYLLFIIFYYLLFFIIIYLLLAIYYLLFIIYYLLFYYFGLLKTYWVETCRQFVFSNPGRAITKFQFSKLFSEAWSKGMSINNIIPAFAVL